MSLRFLADADLNYAVVTGVRKREAGLDLMSAAEARLEGLADPDVLAFATRQGRILISHDTSTMPVHFAEFLRTGGHSPGVLLVRQRASCGEVVESASAGLVCVDRGRVGGSDLLSAVLHPACLPSMSATASCSKLE